MTDSLSESPDTPEQPQPQWKPLSSIDRRVLGVLMEKAKTTPDNYPLSLNAVCSGVNQKSNRDPLMSLEADDVEESLDRLREAGAVGLVQGVGRVTKYRHYAYQWLGVDKVELAVMAELLLRGAQTEGELRGRAARMEPIAGLPELRPVVASLKEKGLVVPLTPEGRGHVVTHALYQPAELEKVRASHGGGAAAARPAVSHSQPAPPTAAVAPPVAPATVPPSGEAEQLRRELSELRAQVAEMRVQLDELGAAQERSEDDLRELRDSLGG